MKVDTKCLRLIEETRHRSVTRKLTPEAKLEREAFIKRERFSTKKVKTLDRYRKELADGSFSISQKSAIYADDARCEMLHVAPDGEVLFSRPMTIQERTLPLGFAS